MLKKIGVILLMLSFLLVGCNITKEQEKIDDGNNTNESENIDKNNGDKENNENAEKNDEVVDKINISDFIPNGSYKVKNKVIGDSYSEDSYIKGDGKRFQLITTTGKGPKVDVFELQDDYIAHIYSGDLSQEEASDLNNVNYLETEYNKSVVMLKSPIEKGNKWDDKEIVDVGSGLEINGQKIDGKYAKTWERDDNTVIAYTFVEKLGLVRISEQVDGTVMSEISIESYEE